MKCISPPELEDYQLLAYWDGEADQLTMLHLEHCEYCREKARTLARFQDALGARLYRATCPSPLELGEYYFKMLPAPQILVLAQHVHECPHCAREIAHMTEFLNDLSPTAGENLIGKVKILIAQLIGGQRGELGPTAALRGEAKGPLVFEAEDIVITLDIQPSPNEFVSLLGQVAAADQDAWTGATVKLQQADLPDLTVSLNDLGAFHFEEVRSSPIQITVMSAQEIVIKTPKINIGV